MPQHRVYAIEIRRVGPIGFAGFVVGIEESGRDGAVLHTTRIYDDPEYVKQLANAWVVEHSRKVPSEQSA